ncbi:UNVERIFIED_CONTAM: hypothetical protein Sindi_0910400 [Sesamum indicum]
MKGIGVTSYILGIKICKDRSKGISGLAQSSYIEKVLKRFEMRNVIKSSKKQSLKIDKELKQTSDIPYASAIGSIQYVVQCTKPNVVFALNVTRRY